MFGTYNNDTWNVIEYAQAMYNNTAVRFDRIDRWDGSEHLGNLWEN